MSIFNDRILLENRTFRFVDLCNINSMEGSRLITHAYDTPFFSKARCVAFKYVFYDPIGSKSRQARLRESGGLSKPFI